MSLLLNVLLNKYIFCIFILFAAYIITNLANGFLNLIDYPLILFIVYLELYEDSPIISFACLIGILYDLLLPNIVGFTSFLFLIFIAIRWLTLKYMDYSKLFVKMLYFLGMPILYISANLLVKGYIGLEYIYIVLNHLIPDVLIIFSILLFMRAKIVFSNTG